MLNNWVLAEITVPAADTPSAAEFYYVILSIWDNAGSYDQIGFTDDNGVWGAAYSYTTGSCSSPTYVYSPDALSLTPGQLYLLLITSADAGTGYASGVWEEIDSVTTAGVLTNVFALHAPTGATAGNGLEQENFYCGDYDYTDYEEVYGTTSNAQPLPFGEPIGFTWYFHENCNGGSGCNSWTTWTSWETSNAPSGTFPYVLNYGGTIPEELYILNLGGILGYVKG